MAKSLFKITGILTFIFVSAYCTSLPEQGTLDVFQREKEISRYPNLESVIIFPVTGDIDKDGEISKVFQKEAINQLGSSSITASNLLEIFRDWKIPEIFPIALQPQLTFFDKVLEIEDLEIVKNENIIRYPGIEYQFNKDFDLRLVIRDLTLKAKNITPLVASTEDLDFETTSGLLKTFPDISSNLTKISYASQRLINPRYLMFAKIKGTEKDYKNQIPISISVIIINFETGAIRSIGRTQSKAENYKVPFSVQVRNLTAILLHNMENSKLNLPELY